MGSVMELVGNRKGELVRMDNREGAVHLEFTIPARGLIGLRTRMLTATAGTAVMHHNFHEYAPMRGEVPCRPNGVMISNGPGKANAFALNNLQERAAMFVEPGDEVYAGQIVAENARDNDLVVNPTTAKKLTNMRTTSSDENIILKPARKMTLEQALEYIEEDELVEVTPSFIRLRKELLDENARKKAGRKKVTEEVVAT
jgi:GTP-binding protein